MSTHSTNPNHYSRWSIEPITFIRANNLDFARANIIKYIMRYDAKDGVRDLDKAQQYMNWLREDFVNKSYPEIAEPMYPDDRMSSDDYDKVYGSMEVLYGRK